MESTIRNFLSDEIEGQYVLLFMLELFPWKRDVISFSIVFKTCPVLFCMAKKVFKKYVNSNNIVLHGHMPREEMLSQMKDYDCGIHISRFDAYSLAVGEMIGCGLPVIVSDKTGNKDDVSKYGLGMVVGLSVEEVENAVKAVSTLQTYNSIVDNIDAFIRNYHMAYGTRMINKYKEIINGTGSI